MIWAFYAFLAVVFMGIVYAAYWSGTKAQERATSDALLEARIKRDEIEKVNDALSDDELDERLRDPDK